MDAGRRAIAEWETDNGPLTAAELAEGLARARALLGRSGAHQPTAPVLAQVWRGDPRQVNVARLLAMCDVEWMTEDQARAVGVLASHSGHDDVVEVTVVEGAIRRGDAVVTSNRKHIAKIAQAADATLRIADV